MTRRRSDTNVDARDRAQRAELRSVALRPVHRAEAGVSGSSATDRLQRDGLGPDTGGSSATDRLRRDGLRRGAA